MTSTTTILWSIIVLFPLLSNSQSCTNWNYDDPNQDWPKCFPLCNEVDYKIQSPVQILEETPDSSLGPLVFDNYGVLENVSLVHSQYKVSLTYPKDYPAELITTIPIRYKLREIHFHVPAEHIVLDDKRHDMEMHMLHYDPHNETQLAIVSVMFKESANDNSWLTEIVAHLSEIKEVNQTVNITVQGLDSSFTTLADNYQNGYWVINGTLTVPPCSQATWYILTEYWQVSKNQLQQFSELVLNNTRPIQRKVNAAVWKPNPPSQPDTSSRSWTIAITVIGATFVFGIIGCIIMKRRSPSPTAPYKKLKT